MLKTSCGQSLISREPQHYLFATVLPSSAMGIAVHIDRTVCNSRLIFFLLLGQGCILETAAFTCTRTIDHLTTNLNGMQQEISTINVIDGQLQSIVDHPPVLELIKTVRPRSRLKEHHKHLFQKKTTNIADGSRDSTGTEAPTATLAIPQIFEELALVACEAGVVCRKELLETFAAATAIHTKFGQNAAVTRVADLAAGHGLLSWFLLVLDEYDDNSGEYDSVTCQRRKHRTAVCIDRRKPAAADIIAKAMLHRFPHLQDRWTYIQADLSSAVDPHPSCLMASVHACGTLSDFLIDMSLKHQASLAIVPCCHTINDRMGYQPHALSGLSITDVAAIVQKKKEQQQHEQHDQAQHQWNKHEVILANAVDGVRCLTLRNAGYKVEEVLLPETFTPRNRLLLGESPIQQTASNDEVSLSATTNGMPTMFRIPLADDPESIAYCRAISGGLPAAKSTASSESTANTYKKTTEPKHYFSQHLSVWLPSPIAMAAVRQEQHEIDPATASVHGRNGDNDNDDDSTDHNSITLVESLQEIANECCLMTSPATTSRTDNNDGHGKESAHLHCTVESLGEEKTQGATGRRSQLYRFKYFKPGGNTAVARASRLAAKRIHVILRARIVEAFGDDVFR